MNRISIFCITGLFILGLGSCKKQLVSKNKEIQVAFMADVHFQDVYGVLSDTNFEGVLHPVSGKPVLARTMAAQLHSTRLFNENYFAFLAALDDVVRRGIKYVVMPGDFSDDGQPVNVRGLKRILDEYTEKYDIRFFLTTGNHDPVRPFSMDGGKNDFIGTGGRQQAIMSKQGLYSSAGADALPVVITGDIRKMGYEEIISELGSFGFLPQRTDVYWETPYSPYKYEEYNFDLAQQYAVYDKRQYSIVSSSTTLPDASYLIEPEEGIWFLAIDANVYIPKESVKINPYHPSNYSGAGLGYNSVLTHKTHLIDWVRAVTARAKILGKKLIVFSHYPMVDFNDDASDAIRNLMGDVKMDQYRIPDEIVARLFAQAGVRVHFAGHMHINDTGVRIYEDGTYIVNIQVPSLAAYIPAYKLATVRADEQMEVETIVMDSVPRFKELFPLYETEHAYLESIKTNTIWDKSILKVNTYQEYTNWHLKELVRLRFLKRDWPEEFRKFLLNTSGKEMLLLSQNHDMSKLEKAEINLNDLHEWTGFDMIVDFYRLRSADQLAMKDITANRIKQYLLVLDNLSSNPKVNLQEEQLIAISHIFECFLNGAPANHFIIEQNIGTIINVKE